MPVRKNQDRMEHQNQGEKMIAKKQVFEAQSFQRNSLS